MFLLFYLLLFLVENKFVYASVTVLRPPVQESGLTCLVLTMGSRGTVCKGKTKKLKNKKNLASAVTCC